MLSHCFTLYSGVPPPHLETLPVDVFKVRVVVKVISHARSVAETLQDGVHIAGVSQVTKTSQRCAQTSKGWVQVAQLSGRWPHILRFGINLFNVRSEGPRITVNDKLNRE